MHSEIVPSGDDALQLRVVQGERMRFAFLPSVGGRLLSLRIDDCEILWQNPRFFDDDLHCVRPRSQWRALDGTFESWSNVGGSKSWPAPQGWESPEEWPGPPDPILDSGHWAWSEKTDGDVIEICMTSPDDVRTGLRMVRIFSIPRSGTTFSERILHIAVGNQRVRWAAWEVCQVRTEGSVGNPKAGIAISTSGQELPLIQGDWWGTVRTEMQESRQWIPIQDAVGKRGFRDATGLVSWTASDGSGLDLSFTPDSSAAYPDGGAKVEVWMQSPLPEPIRELSGLHPDAHLVELEVLGPWTYLEPGEFSELLIHWTVRPPREVTA